MGVVAQILLYVILFNFDSKNTTAQKKEDKNHISRKKKITSRYAPTFLGMRTLSNRVNKEKEINSTMKAGFTLQLLKKKFHDLQTIRPVTHYDLYCTS